MKRGLFALLVACKSQGTIDLSFSPPSGSGCGTASFTTLYAEPSTSCDVCTCGSCAGSKPGEVVACLDEDPSGHCASDVQDVALELGPGHWAVVLELWDSGQRQIASGCVEIDVDADGVKGSSPVGAIQCSTCTTGGTSSTR